LEDRTILIDTSIIIDYFRKQNKSRTVFYKLSTDYNVCISSITAFEVLVGSSLTNSGTIHEILDNILILPFDGETAKRASLIYLNLKKINKVLDFRDIFIAATAISHNIPLSTFNMKHFERIEKLNLFNF
jgi:tRNA(fMet)-specific endonuclease VapC